MVELLNFEITLKEAAAHLGSIVSIHTASILKFSDIEDIQIPNLSFSLNSDLLSSKACQLIIEFNSADQKIKENY